MDGTENDTEVTIVQFIPIFLTEFTSLFASIQIDYI
jgi:hypothetical protein